MRKLGFQILDALEPSQGMLDVAKEKGLYRKYICEAIGKEQLDLPAGSNKYGHCHKDNSKYLSLGISYVHFMTVYIFKFACCDVTFHIFRYYIPKSWWYVNNQIISTTFTNAWTPM